MTATAQANFSDDRATDYANAIVSGRLVAGPHVRSACKRHLNDLRDGPKRGLFWDIDAANWAIEFFETVLCLNGGDYEGVPFVLLGWQAFIIGSLFGWKSDDGYRRFRVAYIETAKGSGKSPLAAGIGLYGLTADQESRSEIYASATKKDQAMILFRDAVAMVDQSPELSERLVQSGSTGKVWNLAYHATDSFFRPLSADDGQSGPRPHMVLLDEIHEHKGPQVVEMMRAGTKSRRQALIFMITNSGHDKTSICYDYHAYSEKVVAGWEDDSFFGYVCALDEKDNPFEDESCWQKANPSLQEANLPGLKYLREQVTQARGMPSKESIVKRLCFCQWVDADNPMISADAWLGSKEQIDIETLRGRKCWGGLDLSSTQDLTSLVLQFEPTEDDPIWRLWSWFWLPGDNLSSKAEKDRVPYIKWRDDGWLQAVPGAAVNKKFVIKKLAEIISMFDLQAVGFDRWRIEDFKMLLDEEGVELPMEPFGQGFKDMSPAIDEFETRLLGGTLRHNGNPVMTWCAANAVASEDPAGNRKINKKKATGRVDGLVAAVMATGQSTSVIEAKPTPAIYF